MAKFQCDVCSKSFGSKESLSQHTATKHKNTPTKSGGSVKKYVVSILVVAIAIFSAMTAYSYTQGPGKYDDFATCLTEKGAVMYGNDFCSFTIQQLNYFGKSQDHLNYVKCVDNNDLCDEKQVSITPTWEYNGQMYSQVQTFKALAAATGCTIE